MAAFPSLWRPTITFPFTARPVLGMFMLYTNPQKELRNRSHSYNVLRTAALSSIKKSTCPYEPLLCTIANTTLCELTIHCHCFGYYGFLYVYVLIQLPVALQVFFLIILCELVFFLHVCLCEGVESPGAGVTDSWELLHGC